jgi:hypothetical protein
MEGVLTVSHHLRFSGPFRWFAGDGVESIFDVSVGKNSGVCLWTVDTTDGELVYYVGETGRSFAVRHKEHLIEQLSGGYHIYEPGPFVRGEKVLLWRGMYGPGCERSLEGFVRKLPELAVSLSKFVNMMCFHVAPFDGALRLRKRVEAAIALHLRGQASPVGSFQDDGVSYAPRTVDETAIDIELAFDRAIRGLPSRVEV